MIRINTGDGQAIKTLAAKHQQTRRISAAEALTSTLTGFVVSLALTLTVLPAFGYAVTHGHAVGITLIYTVASIARSYIVRRLFNGR